MQKKFIFSILFLALIVGFLGGVAGNYWSTQHSDTDFTLSSYSSSNALQSSLVQAQQAVAPSVISIIEYVDRSTFGDAYRYENLIDKFQEVGGGTGFIIDPSGLAITNRHVVSHPTHFYAGFLNDGTRFDLKVEARDSANDIAIVRLVPVSEESYGAELIGNLPFAELGNSSELQIGEQVLAIGNALSEYANTSTAGIVSAMGRKVVASDSAGGFSSLFGLLQTDAAINFGNSGGPLVNLNGQVVGVNTAVESDAQGIGFAIPIDDVKPVVESFRRYGEIKRPMLGVRYVILTESLARELNINVTYGALMVSDLETGESAIVLGSPADVAGLLEGDVILAVDGEKITLHEPLQDMISMKQVGDEVVLRVWRDGSEFEVKVELTNRI